MNFCQLCGTPGSTICPYCFLSAAGRPIGYLPKMTPEDRKKYDDEVLDISAAGFPLDDPVDEEPTRRVGDVLFNAPQTIVTDPKTGGQKGSSLVRPDLLPVLPMAEVAFVYGRGSQKYEDHNWRRGYKWSLSIAALRRHLDKWQAGQSYDPDGFHHLAAVVFHALALMEFENNHPDLDDRFKETP